jgi:hypothetical protein
MYDARFLYYRGCDSDRTYVTERPTLLFAVRVITAVIGLLTTVIGHVPYYVICHIMSYFDYFNLQPATATSNQINQRPLSGRGSLWKCDSQGTSSSSSSRLAGT